VLSEKAVKIQDNNEFFEDNQPPLWGVDAKEKFLPLLNAYNIARLRQYECAINYVLDGRAIYMSALAPQLPDAPDNERIPAEFILYAHQHVPDSAKKVSVNVWELGRLVNQLHILGTVRLAAMKHVKLLHAAGKRLSQLEPTMQKARESVALNETDTMTFIKGAHEQFNSITAEFRKNASCSLAYRIERSGNYVARFRSNIKFLQITGLEGDQPYDQFVERRLGAEFDFIERLGRRYGRAASNITALDQNYLSMETNKIDDETNKIDSGIHKIQEWGEFALLAALAPYYITHLLERFVSDERIPITTIIVWYIFLAIAFFRKFDKKICYRNRNIYSGNVLSRVVLSGIVLSLVSLLIGVGWKLSFVRFSGEPSAQLDVQREVLNAQEELGAIQREQLDVQEELKETQREQLKVVEGVLDALNAEREKKKAEPHRHPQKHQKRSAQ
jgi:hypothetical protein